MTEGETEGRPVEPDETPGWERGKINAPEGEDESPPPPYSEYEDDPDEEREESYKRTLIHEYEEETEVPPPFQGRVQNILRAGGMRVSYFIVRAPDWEVSGMGGSEIVLVELEPKLRMFFPEACGIVNLTKWGPLPPLQVWVGWSSYVRPEGVLRSANPGGLIKVRVPKGEGWPVEDVKHGDERMPVFLESKARLPLIVTIAPGEGVKRKNGMVFGVWLVYAANED